MSAREGGRARERRPRPVGGDGPGSDGESAERPPAPASGFAESPGDGTGPALRFGSLFGDPRHFRGDCRLVASALRAGWLRPEDAPALAERLRAAEGIAEASERGRDRLALGRLVLAIQAAGIDAMMGELRYRWPQSTGRPRERWYVTDHPERIDAAELRRRALDGGADLPTVRRIVVRDRLEGAEREQRVAVEATADAVAGWRLWLRCPRCGSRRRHLYPVRAGVRCRGCARLSYRRPVREGGVEALRARAVCTAGPTRTHFCEDFSPWMPPAAGARVSGRRRESGIAGPLARRAVARLILRQRAAGPGANGECAAGAVRIGKEGAHHPRRGPLALMSNRGLATRTGSEDSRNRRGSADLAGELAGLPR